MKTRAFKVALFLVCVGMGFAAPAVAGFRQAQQVVIVDASSLANGMLGTVRNSADNIQYIMCSSSGTSGFCTARNTAGLVRSCSTSDPNHLATIRSLASDSYLIFFWNTAGTCTSVQVTTSSTHEPKGP